MSALATTSDWAIDLAHVAKTYKGRVRALRGIEMRVRRGEVFGLLGPNGAGKSTLVKILMTVIRPSECRGTLLDHRVGHQATLGRVGYLPEHHQLAGHLTGAQVIDFYGAMAKVSRADRRRRTGELLDLVGMSAWANKRVKGYSKGMRQRLGIAQALVNDPDLVLLDEPTDGVDPVGRRDIRGILQHLKDRGKTVFLNSHLLSELEMVCDRVAILVQGVVASQGTLDELTKDRQRYEIELAEEQPELAERSFQAALPGVLQQGPLPVRADEAVRARALASGAPPVESPLARRVGFSGHLPGGERVELDRGTLRVGTTDANAIQPIIDALRARGAVIRSIRSLRPSLEDLFMQAVTDPNTGEILAPGAASNSRKPGRAGRGSR